MVAKKKKSSAELSEIANRAVATRKANALKEKRHNAAVKAHETRKANALKEKRHNAAVKAWATRRAG